MYRNLRFILLTIPTFIFILLIPMLAANPIPVYPEPEPIYTGSSSLNNINLVWVIGVFIIDFFLDILIVYGGIILLYQYNLISNKDILIFSKKKVFLSILLISLIGLITELFLGPWILGFVIALFLIFASFVLITKYFLNLKLMNAIRMGLFALVINILSWIVVFSL